jgi:hypothetical protein
MITIAEKDLYSAYRKHKKERSKKEVIWFDFILPAFFLGSIGAITYAIRGSGGWGGLDGAVIPGMLMGILWYYILRRRGVNARILVFFIGFGIATGGMWGYGQYGSWIQGDFNWTGWYINPVIGHLWTFISGITIGGAGGILLGYSTGRKRMTWKNWFLRLLFPVGFVLLGYIMTLLFPRLFFPWYGKYGDGECLGCDRTLSTNTSNFMVLMGYIGSLVCALVEKDKNTLACGLIIGIGFGFAQMIGILWVIGYTHALGFADWWKVWELTTGLIWGVSNVFALHWVQEDVDKNHTAEGEPIERIKSARSDERLKRARNRHRTLGGFFSWFALLSLLLVAYYGSTYYLGYTIGLYPYTTDQYNLLLPGRPILLIVGFAVILSIFIQRVRHFMKFKAARNNPFFSMRDLNRKLIYLILYIFLIGICTIWDTDKISLLYSVYLVFALIALSLLDNHYIALERSLSS